MPVPNATTICALTPATAVPGQAVFGTVPSQLGVILEVRPAQNPRYTQTFAECRVRWYGGSERWYENWALHDHDRYLEVVEHELMGLYERRVGLEQRSGIVHRPTLRERP